MSKLQDKFKAIISKIEERITDQEELDFIKEQIADLSMIYIDELNKIMDLSERRVNQIYENQKIIEKKMLELEKGMNTIEKELFVEEEYDFEIVCPYCNYEFLTDINSNKKEIKCPECHNTIELDWNGAEHDCAGHCGHCDGCEDHNDEENISSAEIDVEDNRENIEETNRNDDIENKEIDEENIDETDDDDM